MFKPQKEQFKKAKEKKMFKISETKKPNTSRAWKTYSTSSPRDRRFPSRKRSGRRGRGYRSPCQLCRWLVAGCIASISRLGKERKNSYLSNQLPSTPLEDLNPPTCTPSERHRSSPWKMEKVVQRIWPSGVWRTVPRSVVSLSSAFTLIRRSVYSPRILLFAFGSQLA